jgi:hypothetical protein
MSSFGNSEITFFGYWTKNLVESPIAFTFNLMVSLIAGVLYSFNVIPSPYLLFIFGIVSPIIFTICLYDLMLSSNGEIMGEAIPKAFSDVKWGRLVMLFDCFLIVLFATLIQLNILNFFIFRFLQTLFFPVLLLVMLKGFYFFKYQG